MFFFTNGTTQIPLKRNNIALMAKPTYKFLILYVPTTRVMPSAPCLIDTRVEVNLIHSSTMGNERTKQWRTGKASHGFDSKETSAATGHTHLMTPPPLRLMQPSLVRNKTCLESLHAAPYICQEPFYTHCSQCRKKSLSIGLLAGYCT